MSNPIDGAFERFQKLESDLRAALKTASNEADTRLKVLDCILFEVLDWKHEAVFTEPPTASGYIDYLLTIGEKRGAMVVEAKKGGLLAPATKTNDLMYVALSGPVVKPLLPGIQQAMMYALENGVYRAYRFGVYYAREPYLQFLVMDNVPSLRRGRKFAGGMGGEGQSHREMDTRRACRALCGDVDW
jgi:hypothetical protein